MSDRPIIFSGPMVRALLAGRKTMTRRLASSPLRKAQPGDRLWVRESLKHVASDPVTAEPCSLHCYMANIPAGMDSANPYEDNYLFAEEGDVALKPRSIPSIHMPRWASRLTLAVTGVKVERVQDISDEDAKAEGIAWCDAFEWWHCDPNRDGAGPGHCSSPANAFLGLWLTLHGEESLAENPEVVAISFRVIKSNIEASTIPQAHSNPERKSDGDL